MKTLDLPDGLHARLEGLHRLLVARGFELSINQVLELAIKRLEDEPPSDTSPEDVVQWWNELVVPYAPYPEMNYLGAARVHIIDSLREVSGRDIKEALRKMPRLRGMVHSSGFGFFDLFRPRPNGEKRRIISIATGRYDTWKVIRNTKPELDIIDVVEGKDQPCDWLVLPTVDRHGVYQRPDDFAEAFTTQLCECQKYTARFVLNFIEADAFYERRMRRLLNPLRSHPERFL